MNERSKTILDCIIKLSPVSLTRITKELGYSPRQIDYSIMQINEELQIQNISTIEKIKGSYYIHTDARKWFTKINDSINHDYIYSKMERVYGIIIKIFLCKDIVSLDSLSFDLSVSKNTILSDLKICHNVLKKEDKNLKITNNKNDGYCFQGDEWHKRIISIKAIQSMLSSCGEEQLRNIMDVTNEDYHWFNERIQAIEKQLSVEFTDYQFTFLIYCLKLLENRIEQKKYVNKNLFIQPEELSDTKEYEASKRVLSIYNDIPQSEILYMTLQLLTSNTIRKDILDSVKLDKLNNALNKFIDLFEQIALLEISDKGGLLKRLISHFKPAYYRIKYRLTTSYEVVDKISKGFGPLNELVKQSIAPVEEYLECAIPDNEIAYISLFMGGALIEKDKTLLLERKIATRAMVVCPSGITMSNIMKDSLISVFPEFYFYPAISIRKFKEFKYPYDIVFSSVQVNSLKPLFVINEIMDEEEKYYLKKRVMNALYGTDISSFDIDSALQIIRRNTEKVVDEKKLREELFFLLNKKTDDVNEKDEVTTITENIDLINLLEENGITVVDKVSTWNEALLLSSSILLDNGKITKQYQEELQMVFAYPEQHIVLNQEIAIPHLEAQYGVVELGMSMLVINEKCIDEELGCKIPQIIVTIAVKEGLKHLPALQQLMRLSRDKKLLEKVVECTQKTGVKQILATMRGDKGD